MLIQILKFLKKETIASNQQIAREFQLDITALQPMLDIWLKKGRIICCEEKTKCQSSCFKCKSQPPIYYEYRL